MATTTATTSNTASTPSYSGAGQSGYWTEGKVVNGTNVGGGTFVQGAPPQSYVDRVNSILGGGSSAKTPPPPVNDVMNAGSLAGGSSSLNVPQTQPPQSSNAFVGSMGSYTNPVSTSGSDSNSGTSAPVSLQDARKNAILSAMMETTGEIGQEGNAYNNLSNQYQIPQTAQNLAQIRGTIAQRTAQYMSQWNQANNEDAALPYIVGEQTQIQRTQAIEIGMLTAQEQALSGNLQAAQDIVDRTIQHEFEPLKTQLQALQSFYTMNQNDLSTSEQMQLTQNYNLQTINYQNLLNTKKDAYSMAIQYTQDPQLLSKLTAANSINDVWSALSSIIGGGGTGGSGVGLINGYDFGNWAVNDDGTTNGTFINNVTSTSSKIGALNNRDDVQNAIQKLAPKSPITADMIINAANQAGVDPNTLISVMYAETQLGTDGSAGSKYYNFGNVGNTNSAMASGNPVTTYKGNAQAGVLAAANAIKNRKVSVGQAVAGDTKAQGGATQSGVSFSDLKSQAPSFLAAPGILNQVTSTGGAYIDLSKIPKEVNSIMVSNWARSHNVAVLNADEVSQVKSVDEAIRNITEVVAPAWQDIAYTNRAEQIGNKFTEPFASLFDTDFYSKNKTFLKNKENLAQQISALSKSSPRLGLLETATDALPDNSGYFTGGKGIGTNFNPLSGFGAINYGTGDTFKDGNNKLNRTLQLLNQAVASYIPGDKGVPLLNVNGTPNTQSIPKGTDGASYGFPGYVSDGSQWVKSK